MDDPWSGLLAGIERVQACKDLCAERRETYGYLIEVLESCKITGAPGQHALHEMVDAYDEIWHEENPNLDFCPIFANGIPMAFPFMLTDIMEQGVEDDVIKLLRLAIAGTQAHEAMHDLEQELEK